MEDKAKNCMKEEDKATYKNVAKNCDDNGETNNDAGPSGSIALPGAVQNPKNTQNKTGAFKSEHSIRHIITNKDVSNALKAFNFTTPSQTVRNLNLRELKIPILGEEIIKRDDDTASLIELKNIVASCFKLNKEPANAIVTCELPRQSVPKVTIPIANNITGPVDDTCVSNVIQTECVPPKTSEVIKKPVEPKVSKATSEKKKISTTVSERSEITIAQRDSLSSIGSNVCRICMTRGKERLISPCNCKGSLANVHLSCLERWLNQVGRNHCELCGYSYPAIRTPRYTVLQALRLWFGNPRNRSHLQNELLYNITFPFLSRESQKQTKGHFRRLHHCSD